MSLVYLARVRALAAELGRTPTERECRKIGVWVGPGKPYRTTRALMLAAGLTPRAVRSGRLADSAPPPTDAEWRAREDRRHMAALVKLRRPVARPSAELSPFSEWME